MLQIEYFVLKKGEQSSKIRKYVIPPTKSNQIFKIPKCSPCNALSVKVHKNFTAKIVIPHFAAPIFLETALFEISKCPPTKFFGTARHFSGQKSEFFFYTELFWEIFKASNLLSNAYLTISRSFTTNISITNLSIDTSKKNNQDGTARKSTIFEGFIPEAVYLIGWLFNFWSLEKIEVDNWLIITIFVQFLCCHAKNIVQGFIGTLYTIVITLSCSKMFTFCLSQKL